MFWSTNPLLLFRNSTMCFLFGGALVLYVCYTWKSIRFLSYFYAINIKILLKMIYLLITKITKIKSAYRWKFIQYYTFVCSACIDMKFVCLNIQLGYTVPQCEFMINYDVFFPAKVIYHTFGELGRVEQIWVFIVNLKNMFSHFNNKWGCLRNI